MQRGNQVTILAVTLLCLAALAAVLAWVVPAIDKRWGTKDVCPLREIGISMKMYAGEHEGKFPESFGVMLKEGYLTTPKVFVNRHSGSRVPDDFPGCDEPKDADLAMLHQVHDFGDYALARYVSNHCSGDVIIVYERRVIYDRLRGCFFNDGHVEWISEDQFQEQIRKQEGELRQGPRAEP